MYSVQVAEETQPVWACVGLVRTLRIGRCQEQCVHIVHRTLKNV
jgi:hypothetical protein